MYLRYDRVHIDPFYFRQMTPKHPFDRSLYSGLLTGPPSLVTLRVVQRRPHVTRGQIPFFPTQTLTTALLPQLRRHLPSTTRVNRIHLERLEELILLITKSSLDPLKVGNKVTYIKRKQKKKRNNIRVKYRQPHELP